MKPTSWCLFKEANEVHVKCQHFSETAHYFLFKEGNHGNSTRRSILTTYCDTCSRMFSALNTMCICLHVPLPEWAVANWHANHSIKYSNAQCINLIKSGHTHADWQQSCFSSLEQKVLLILMWYAGLSIVSKCFYTIAFYNTQVFVLMPEPHFSISHNIDITI